MHYFSGKGCSESLESMHYCIGILSIAQILLGCAILICATVLNLWLEVKYKNFLVKKEFILSIDVFLGALRLTK